MQRLPRAMLLSEHPGVPVMSRQSDLVPSWSSGGPKRAAHEFRSTNTRCKREEIKSAARKRNSRRVATSAVQQQRGDHLGRFHWSAYCTRTARAICKRAVQICAFIDGFRRSAAPAREFPSQALFAYRPQVRTRRRWGAKAIGGTPLAWCDLTLICCCCCCCVFEAKSRLVRLLTLATS